MQEHGGRHRGADNAGGHTRADNVSRDHCGWCHRQATGDDAAVPRGEDQPQLEDTVGLADCGRAAAAGGADGGARRASRVEGARGARDAGGGGPGGHPPLEAVCLRRRVAALRGGRAHGHPPGLCDRHQQGAPRSHRILCRAHPRGADQPAEGARGLAVAGRSEPGGARADGLRGDTAEWPLRAPCAPRRTEEAWPVGAAAVDSDVCAAL